MSLTPIPLFTEPSHKSRNSNKLLQTINLFPEKISDGYQLVSSPGLKYLSVVPNNNACVGSIAVVFNGAERLYTVNGNKVYRVSHDGTVTTITGTVGFGTSRVQIATSGTQLVIVGNNAGYVVDMAGDTVTAIADGSFPTYVSSVVYLNGRFIVNNIPTGAFYLSAINDGTVWHPALSNTIGTNISGSPQALVAIKTNGTYLYLIGTNYSQVWYYTGNSDFPYEPVNGAILPIGTYNAHTASEINGSIFLIGNSGGGPGTVWEIAGTQIKKISTYEAEEDLASFDSTMFSYAHQERGHFFFTISGATTNTWVYDISEDAWHRREFRTSGYNYVSAIRNIYPYLSDSDTGCYALDNVFGQIFTINSNYNQNNGASIVRTLIFGPVESGRTTKAFHKHLRFEIEAEYDAVGSTSISASLDWTDDAGLTYGTAITLTKTIISSAAGQRVLLMANRLGSSASRYYRLIFTGPAAKLILKKCEIELSEGRF